MERSIENLGDHVKTQMEKDTSDAAERHVQALEMLDNIQRRRNVYPRKFGDRAY
jgi:hypothetical protein